MLLSLFFAAAGYGKAVVWNRDQVMLKMVWFSLAFSIQTAVGKKFNYKSNYIFNCLNNQPADLLLCRCTCRFWLQHVGVTLCYPSFSTGGRIKYHSNTDTYKCTRKTDKLYKETQFHIYIYKCMCVHIHIYIHIYMYVCVCVYKYIDIKSALSSCERCIYSAILVLTFFPFGQN